jgi:hypothetical protein
VLLGNALLPDICPCLDFATWLQQRALLQLHYRVGKVSTRVINLLEYVKTTVLFYLNIIAV